MVFLKTYEKPLLAHWETAACPLCGIPQGCLWWGQAYPVKGVKDWGPVRLSHPRLRRVGAGLRHRILTLAFDNSVVAEFPGTVKVWGSVEMLNPHQHPKAFPFLVLLLPFILELPGEKS